MQSTFLFILINWQKSFKIINQKENSYLTKRRKKSFEVSKDIGSSKLNMTQLPPENSKDLHIIECPAWSLLFAATTSRWHRSPVQLPITKLFTTTTLFDYSWVHLEVKIIEKYFLHNIKAAKNIDFRIPFKLKRTMRMVSVWIIHFNLEDSQQAI